MSNQVSHATITTDGSVGPMQTLIGPNVIIPQDLGSLHGANLFHSFRTFNIDSGQSATFTGDNTIANVISRVTGGETSHINGLLRSTIGQADFYLINPGGVVFGPRARVDVPAAFHVSTANELKFTDGHTFSATDPGSSTLTQAPPEAFGFLEGTRSQIEINGSRFEFGPERTVSLSAGAITIQGGEDAGHAARTPVLQTEAGNIYLMAVGERTVTAYPDGREASEAGGELLLEGARVDVSGDGGGRIFIQAGNAVVGGGSVLAADNTGKKPPEGGIEMLLNGHLEVTGGSRIQINIFDRGDSGTIHIGARSLLIRQNEGDDSSGIFIETEPTAAGCGTALTVHVQDDLRIEGAGGISSTTYGDGQAASVTVQAGNIRLNGEGRLILYRDNRFSARILSEVSPASRGNSGVVTVSTPGLLEVINAAGISSSTWGRGDAGQTNILAGQMVVDQQGCDYATGVLSDALAGSEGSAGKVSIAVAERLQILNGGVIRSNTWSSGDAGRVWIAAGNMIVDRQGSDSFTGVSSGSEKESTGKAGEIAITITEHLQLINGGQIGSGTFARGDAGRVMILAEQMTINSQGSRIPAGIFSSAEDGSEGNAGEIGIMAKELLLLNGGQISSSSFATGDAGHVTITSDQMTVDGRNGFIPAIVTSSAEKGSQGHAGNVTITVAGLLQILNGGQIGSVTFARGDAGSVNIRAGELIIDGQDRQYVTGIASQATPDSEGHVGTVDITVAGLIQLLNGARITIAAYQTLPADRLDHPARKSVTITASNLTLNNHSEVTSESTRNAPSGDIVLTVNQVVLDNNSKISTQSGNANAGAIIILGNVIHLQNSRITTSAEGAIGDGGSITLKGFQAAKPVYLIMNRGFIQANTAAVGAKGGDINLALRGILVEKNSGPLSIDDPERQKFQTESRVNIIQAAAEAGTKGQINVGDAPELVISGDLVLMPARPPEPVALAVDPCELALAWETASSLVQGTREGLPVWPGAYSRIVFDREMLEELLQ